MIEDHKFIDVEPEDEELRVIVMEDEVDRRLL